MSQVFRLRDRVRDGEYVRQLRCPGCGEWADLDDDQLLGRVSVWHDEPGCGYHETRDFSDLIERGQIFYEGHHAPERAAGPSGGDR